MINCKRDSDLYHFIMAFLPQAILFGGYCGILCVMDLFWLQTIRVMNNLFFTTFVIMAIVAIIGFATLRLTRSQRQ